jgi:tyrosyl-tRNA synthetase
MRLIKQGAVSVDDKKVGNADAKLPRGEYIVKAGKRKFAKVRAK